MTAIAGAVALAACTSLPPVPAPMAKVRVMVFRGASNIPIYMAVERGAFARHGIAVDLQFTPNSDQLRAGLAAGRFDVAHAGVDNAVAMVDVAKADAVIVGGGEAGMNELLVRPEIARIEDLRGRVLVVDAPNTAYALVGRKILKNAGLIVGRDYRQNPLGGSESRTKALDTPEGAATVLNPPWSTIAKDHGAKSLGRVVDMVGPYQATGAFVMRPWARENAGLLSHYLAAYIEGCRAAQDPANRRETIAVLARELKVDQRIAESTYADLMTPGHGLAKECAFDDAGFRNVLALRAEMENQSGGAMQTTAPPTDRYVDLRYWETARALAAR